MEKGGELMFEFIAWILYATGIGFDLARRAVMAVINFFDDVAAEEEQVKATQQLTEGNDNADV